MLAEKVETDEEFQWARAAGYDLFQGYFFAQPAVVRGRQIPGRKLTSLQLLTEMQNADLDFRRLETLIRQDVSLPFKLLRYANSAFYRRSGEVRSIDQALATLGEIGIRRWVVLASLPVLGQDKPGELIALSLLRARFCERLAQLAGVADHGQAFLMGLFSLLDALIDLPLDESLQQIKVSEAVAAALLQPSSETGLSRVFQLAKSYEAGDWANAKTFNETLRIPPAEVSSAYSESVLWSQRALRGVTRTHDGRRRTRHPARGNLRFLCTDDAGSERIMSGKLINVSVQGLQLELLTPLRPRTRVHCNDVPLGIAGNGVVRYCNPAKGKYLVGIEFPDGTGWREPLT
jgi:c-di-GMP-related signal transduction protein